MPTIPFFQRIDRGICPIGLKFKLMVEHVIVNCGFQVDRKIEKPDPAFLQKSPKLIGNNTFQEELQPENHRNAGGYWECLQICSLILAGSPEGWLPAWANNNRCYAGCRVRDADWHKNDGRGYTTDNARRPGKFDRRDDDEE